jgi:hypothetical protein
MRFMRYDLMHYEQVNCIIKQWMMWCAELFMLVLGEVLKCRVRRVFGKQ